MKLVTGTLPDSCTRKKAERRKNSRGKKEEREENKYKSKTRLCYKKEYKEKI